jgi:diguanylate cyclase (GGDEF)-like protein
VNGGPTRWRLSVLTAVLSAIALVVAVGGLVLPAAAPGDGLPAAARFALAAGLAAVAQLARLRTRVAAGLVNLAWGEAALVVGLYLVPPGWLPAATLLGAAATWVALSVFVDRTPLLVAAHVTASLTVAAALAAAVSVAAGVSYPFAPTPVPVLASSLGALTYLLVTVCLAVLTLALAGGPPTLAALLPTLRGRALMFVGNVLVGLAVIAAADRAPAWLLVLPAVLWLLQRTYRHRLGADDERRTWSALAEATGGLNRLDEAAVATAGATGAQRLFQAELVEVDVLRDDGWVRRYRTDLSGRVVRRDVEPADHPGSARLDPEGVASELTRALVVDDVPVGELRIRLPRCVLPGPRDRAALAAFSDALGAALHDAATHRRLREATERSRYDAAHDPLTGLVNRAAMFADGDAALRRLPRDHPVAVLLLDISHFREVNDTLGHDAGDQLLKVAAARLGTLARPGELLGRLGGDEFALLVTALLPDGPEPTGLGDRPRPVAYAVRRAREVVELVTAPTEVAGVTMSVEASVGVVVAGAGVADMTELLRRADVALHQARAGGGRVASYDAARDVASTDQLVLLTELREALAADDQLVLALQPAVDLTTGEPTGVEALIRWSHPRRGWLSPAEFIDAVEASDLLGAFTRYVVDRALAVAAEWARQGLDVPISINVSARSLLDPGLPAEVTESLRRHGVPAHRLVLEITETVAMSDLEVIDEVLAALRAAGVRIAVDDFGTGYSSMAFLTRVAVDELKVDRSFVARMADSPQAAAIVRSTVDLGRSLGLRVVAEGVETADQRLALARLGCTAAQGYLFFKPMPSDKIATVLRSLLDSAQARVFPLRADGVS